jgi:hypothetical protein
LHAAALTVDPVAFAHVVAAEAGKFAVLSE